MIQKKKFILSAVIFTLFVLLFTSASTVSAEETENVYSANADKIWSIRFTQEIEFEKLKDKDVRVVDSQGKCVDIKLKLGDDNKHILVMPPVKGYKSGENYCLCVSDNIYSKKQKKLKSPASIKFKINVDEIGNTVGNIVNKGFATEKGEWIYFSNGRDNNKLYKMKIDGTSKSKIDNDQATYINIVGEWIYYSNVDHLEHIYKIKTNGTGKTEITSEGAINVNVVGDWIYYINKSDNYKIYKVRTNGTEKNKINDDMSKYLNVVDNYIYYSNIEDFETIYKVKIDGKGIQKLNNHRSQDINVVGNWIYYREINNTDTNVGEISKMKLDGTGKCVLSCENAWHINVIGNYIYYMEYSDEYSLCRMQIDGKNKIKLNYDNVWNINSVGSWLCTDNWKEDNVVINKK